MGKAYFTPELFSFLKQIKRNNRRPWFLKNRERYEEVARQPGLRFVVDFGFRLKEISPWIVVNTKPHHGSLQRIYRDVRFSPDKRPYKTWVGMTFPHAGRTEEARAVGYYLHLEAEGSFLYGGTWQPDRRSLAKIRDAIAWKPEEWKKAKRGLTLEGSRLTRAPRGYPETHPMIEDLKWVDFVSSVAFSQKQVSGPSFLRDVTAGAKKLAPLLGFLARAQGLQF
ncbi:MAG TPA: TIGR02453 family protein [Terriglobales bacterium]|nr:TIGR02453 family protein [Terriglobales bacterium]